MRLCIKSLLMLGVVCLVSASGVAAQSSAVCRGDINKDGKVDGNDVKYITHTDLWLNKVPAGDMAYKRQVLTRARLYGASDLTVILANFGPCSGGTVVCPGDLTGDGVVNAMDIAENASLASPSGCGIAAISSLSYVMNHLNITLNWGPCSSGKKPAVLDKLNKTQLQTLKDVNIP